jgi:hypothetical protein
LARSVMTLSRREPCWLLGAVNKRAAKWAGIHTGYLRARG